MAFARKVWKLLVAIKDGLVLLFMLLFFMALYAALSARPGPGLIRDGALLLELDGIIVEEPSLPDPLSLLLTQQAPLAEYRSRDVVRALRAAAGDERINSVVIDMSGFLGAGFVHLQDIGDALDEVRKAGKPVLTYGIAYIDDGMLLAAHADEVWVDPNGGAFVTGPGGNMLYFGRLLEKLKVNARIFRVGTFKSAVEPYVRNESSDVSERAYEALYGALWDAWKADYAKARPKAELALVTSDPVAWFKASGGDAPQAAKAAGLVDRIGTRTEFGERVAEIAGEGLKKDVPGEFAHTPYRTWLGANAEKSGGKAIAVVTIAGEIIDGEAGPGIAGGDRIVGLLNEGLSHDYGALVVRVDSPGGSVIASERVRKAIARYKAQGTPVVVSMANVAASGGYWVATPADRIFAEPATITGSIGIFAVLPTFERALADFGVTGDGVKTTPLSGQPDVLTGLAPEVSDMIQMSIENGYGKFVELVSRSRNLPAQNSAQWADGRPWAGGTARQLGLVDEFGGLDDALAHAAKLAKIEDGGWHPRFLGKSDDGLRAMLLGMRGEQRTLPGAKGFDLVGIAAERQRAMLGTALAQANAIMSMRGLQAYCLECPGNAANRDSAGVPEDTSGFLRGLMRLTER